MKALVYARRPATVEAVQFDGSMESFDAIHDWMEATVEGSNGGYSEDDGQLHFTVYAGAPPNRKASQVIAGMWVLHRYVGGRPMFWVLTPEEFSDLYDATPI